MDDFTESILVAFMPNAVASFSGAAWLGVAGSTVTDLVLPRMRGTSTAIFLLAVTLLGLALGPFTVGLVSDLTGDLRSGLAVALCVNVPAAALIAISTLYLPGDEASLISRARAAGEQGI